MALEKQNPTQGQNPDYYGETASLGPHPLQSNPPQQGSAGQTAPAEQQQQPYYPPPPPGPPPSQTNPAQQHQQPYYPPPPGLQPSQGNPPQQQPYYWPPPGASYQHLPSYAQPGPGAPPPYSPLLSGQNVPPPMPPRPSNTSGSAPASSSGSSKPTFGERLHQWSVKAGIPINKVTNKLGSEAFWPTTMDLECDKAARILKSFCKDGFYTNAPAGANINNGAAVAGPKGKPKVLVKIPQKAIQSAAGLAIFTTFRSGLHISGAGGSGIIVARLPDGRWSPPSGFLVHTLGAGFMIGLDIYDCVCVLRTAEAVRAFTHPRVSLGGEIGLVAGPVGAGASVEAAISKDTKPVWSYMKSRGLYAGVQADGTIVIGRPDANAAFYGKKGITVDQILKGEVPARGPPGMWPTGARQLVEVLKAAEGRTDVDEGVMKDVSSGPTPGDLGMGESEKEVVITESEKEKQ